MLPKGGNYIWGNSTFAPDNVLLKGNMISFAPHERSETFEDELLRKNIEKEEENTDITSTNLSNTNLTAETNTTGANQLKRVKTKSLLKQSKKKNASPSPSPHALVQNVTMDGAIEWMIRVANDIYFERYIR